jgi:hypothetical protein
MPTKKEGSRYDLRGMTPTDEPLWFRLVIWLSLLLFYLGLAYLLLSHRLLKYAIPALGLGGLSRLPGIKNRVNRKNRSP